MIHTAIARGMVRSDRRAVNRAFDDAPTLVELIEALEAQIEPRFARRRTLRPEELASIIDIVDNQLTALGAPVVRQLHRPGGRIHKHPQFELLGAIPATYTRKEVGDGGFGLGGIRFFANHKLVRLNFTKVPIAVTDHCVQRAIERRGINCPEIYDVGRSPLQAFMNGLIDSIGLLACFVLHAERHARPMNFLLPLLDGFCLGDVDLPLDQTKDMHTAVDVVFDNKGYFRDRNEHPLLKLQARAYIATFVHDTMGRPDQLEMAGLLESFVHHHYAAVITLGVKLMWRETNLLALADDKAIAAALDAFADLADAADVIATEKGELVK
jgi:hypothetical protein